jgi:hypothetical protein
MKHSNPKFNYFILSFIIIFLVTSCNSIRYTAVPCPDIPQGPKTKEYKAPKSFKIFASRNNKNNKSRINRSKSNTNSKQINPSVQVISVNNEVVNEAFEKPVTASIITPAQISLKNPPPPSEEYYNRLIEYNEPQQYTIETNYSDVESLSPYIPSLSTSEVRTLRKTSKYQNSSPQIEGLGIAGFVSGVVGLIIMGIPLGIVATTFGAISLSKINKNPDKYTGRGFSIASLVLGIIDIAAVVLILLLI